MTPSILPSFEHDLFRPVFRPFKGERWEMRIADMVLCPGYWSPPRLVHGMAALMRLEEDGAQTWMSMTPMEIESQELGCRFAAGDTVVLGMGMGWAAANAALRSEVSRVTVVERDSEVIAMIASLDVFGQLPEEARAKITVIEGDACLYRPDHPADTLLADIWRPVFSADRDAEVRRMHANIGGSRVYFWGQEMVIAHRLRKAGRQIDTRSVEEAVGDMALPLIGPSLPDYPVLIAQAAARWLKGA